jgi:hypothetical protein
MVINAVKQYVYWTAEGEYKAAAGKPKRKARSQTEAAGRNRDFANA